jgi:DNA-binding transcriptional LysR family regulator
MSLTHARLRAVNAVVEEGTFSAAARRLGMTQPAVSQAIHKLEEGFGVRLFEPRGRYLIPTEFCLDLTRVTTQIQRLEDEALSLLERGDSLETGSLRVGLGNTMPGMALIGSFNRAFPNVRLDVRFGNFTTIINSVLEREVDVGLLPNLPGDGRFHSQVCMRQKVVAIVPPTHPLAGRDRVSARELARHPMVFRSRGSLTQRLVDRLLAREGIEVVPRLTLESRDGVCEAVANGLGVGFIWNHGTGRTNGITQVTVLGLEEAYDEVVFRRSDTQNKIVDAFFHVLIQVGKREREEAVRP